MQSRAESVPVYRQAVAANELIAADRDAVERHSLIVENARLRAEVGRLEKEMSALGLAPAS